MRAGANEHIRRGFTMIEALAAVVLIGAGLVAATKCLGGMAQARTRAFESEDMQRLALGKLDEIVALDSLPSGSSEGDFEDAGEKRFVWRAERTPTGTGNLDVLRVEVTRRGESYAQATEVQGLFCRPATTQGQGKP
jgi:prepilin-type N-terminal cleavage/methylation domain-containing protein